MFIFLLLCSRYLELAARRKAAGTLEKLQHALPAAASRIADYPAGRAAETIAVGNLCEGDIILVKPGEALAADGVIVEGDSTLDFSLLTGESRALYKTVGDLLPGGALNAGQAIVVRVTRRASDSTLSVLMKLIERAGQAKPRLSLWADRVAAWFVAALLLFAVLVFCLWQLVDPARAWPIAIAVLVVSCPCALSVATPTALAAATDRLLRQGVLVVKPHVLETLHNVTHMIFDKTGTLTVGKPVLHRVTALAAAPRARCLQIAAALEASNAHPLSAAIMAAARADDAVRGDARQVIEYFQASGKTVILLSGDQQALAERIAADLGIRAAYGEYLPDQKLAFVQALQHSGAVVAMVGDGINDAAVLRAADVSFAMGTGAPLAQAQADAVLLSGRLSAMSDAARAASQTMAVIRQNLAWATLYNVIAIPAAAIGLLSPWLTGVGMALSSAIVVLNALRLQRMSRPS